MASKVQRIPPREWNHWKETILALRGDKTLEDVMTIMEDDHGFRASVSQYESQLDSWGDRKNLKKHEWAVVLAELDELTSQGLECRIRISGHVVSAQRIKRARRHCFHGRDSSRRGSPKERSVDLRKVCIESLGPAGNWISYTNLDESGETLRVETAHERSLPETPPVQGVSSDPPRLDYGEPSNPEVDEDITSYGLEATSHHFDPPQLSETQGFEIEMEGEQSLPSQLSTTSIISPLRPFTAQSSSHREPSSIDGFNSGWSPGLLMYSAEPSPQASVAMLFGYSKHVRYFLDDLPFERFKKTLGPKGIYLTGRSRVPLGFPTASTVQTPFSLFVEDLESTLANKHKAQPAVSRWNTQSIKLSLQNLLLSQNVREAHDGNRTPLITEEILQTQFSQALVRSMLNGFAGLQDVPIHAVLRYLGRDKRIGSLLLHFLQVQETHAAKALAENLFLASIEEKDVQVLKSLLETRLLDINAMICIANGRKYTPIERAASLQCLEMIRLFISYKADVNKTFNPRPWYTRPRPPGALATLIGGIERGATIALDTVELVEALLKVGAKIDMDMVKQCFAALHGQQLARILMSWLPDSHHSELISCGILSTIALYLDDGQATEAIGKILFICERHKCQCYSSQFAKELDWALIEGAKRGHLQLVQLLLGRSESLHSALSAAIKGGSEKVIDIVLASRPDLDAPAHRIVCEPGQIKTTSLAEAIKARNEKLVLLIEGSSALKHLHEGGRFQPAITAASEVGDAFYVKKLLYHCYLPNPSDMSRAVLHSIENNNEAIFWDLMEAGAEVNNKRMPGRVAPIIAALVRRNAIMVRGILEADLPVAHGPHGLDLEGVISEGVKWGDISILKDLQSVFPTSFVSPSDLGCVLDEADKELFAFLLQSGMVDSLALTCGLVDALKKNDSKLASDLIALGADPFNDGVLTICAMDNPEMLEHFLQQKPRNCQHVVAGFGSNALKIAIGLGHSRFKAVEVLIDTGCIDVKCFASPTGIRIPDIDGHTFRFYHRYSNLSALGVAIKVSEDGDHGDFFVITKLLEAGCNPDSVTSIHDGKNQTALLDAIETKSKALVQLLIDHGASINKKPTLGLKRTPLQQAVEVDNVEVIMLLLGAGANVNEAPAMRYGATALQLAAIRGNLTIAAELLERGADLHAKPPRIGGRWPLEGAAEHGRLEMIEYLWNVSVTGFDREQCLRAMKLAQENGHMACSDLIEELLKKNGPAPDPLADFDTQIDWT